MPIDIQIDGDNETSSEEEEDESCTLPAPVRCSIQSPAPSCLDRIRLPRTRKHARTFHGVFLRYAVYLARRILVLIDAVPFQGPTRLHSRLITSLFTARQYIRPQSMQGVPKSFWDLLDDTARARKEQAAKLSLTEQQPRTAIAAELQPFVNSTRWPHDNSPLPEYLVSIARARPTRFTPRFDNTNQWTFYKLDARGRGSLSLLCFSCFLMPTMVITLWLLFWCPAGDTSLSIQPPEQPPVACADVAAVSNATNSTKGCDTALLDDFDVSVDEASCDKLTRFAVLATFLLLLGCPGMFCLVSALEPVIDHMYYYYLPLSRQLYVNYPEVFDGYGPVGEFEPETRLVNHLRCLTLLYTVDALSRMPAPSRQMTWLGKFWWRCQPMYHYQWARSHREWVLRVDVNPDGSVVSKLDVRVLGAGDRCFDFVYRALERLGGCCGGAF